MDNKIVLLAVTSFSCHSLGCSHTPVHQDVVRITSEQLLSNTPPSVSMNAKCYLVTHGSLNPAN